MKILYDHQIYQHQRIGGVSRYFTEIIKHLPNTASADVSVQYSFNEYLKHSDIPFQYLYQLENRFLPDRRFKGQGLITKYMEKYFPKKYPNRYLTNKEATIKKIKAGDFDVFHPTFFEDYYLEALGDKPFVLTVHDMTLELYPELTYSLDFVKRKKNLVNRAAHIIAVSENTKNDLVNIFGTEPDKISLIHHASSLITPNAPNPNLKLPQRYLLYVGDRRLGYKNFAFFILSVLPILEQYPDIDIVCVGGELNGDERYFLNALNITNRIKQMYVSDEDMYQVYNQTQMFVYPSYYEGFGIPILEAFQAKCPVVLADASCFREVAGNAALYFEPKNPNQLRTQINSLLNNEVSRDELVDKGLTQLQKYSWQKSAEETVDVYKKVLTKY